MEYQNILVGMAFVLLFSLFSKPIEKTVLSGPFLALFVGLLFGPALLDVLKIQIGGEKFKIIAELALALVLFSDASKTNLSVLQKNASIPIRLLLIGLPITIVLGMISGNLLFQGFSWIEVGILATMLAPTDAALGKAVVTNEAVPSKIRGALNIESGLNDGICVPLLFLFIALFDSLSGDKLHPFFGLGLLIKEIGIGLLVGLSITYAFVWVANYANQREWISESWKQMLLIVLSFTCFVAAQMSGGSGFIACFAGGFLFGTLKNRYQLKMSLLEPVEGVGDTMSLMVWLIFGSIIAAFAQQFTWEVILYAVLSLTVIRIVPVMLALINTKLSGKEKLFIGWFGPRGLATIVFAIIVLEVELPHSDTIILTAACVVLLSVVLHGFSAKPFINILKEGTSSST